MKTATDEVYRAPVACPVCGDGLVISRLVCPSCSTELAGEFGRCAFCALDDADLDLLRVFLTGRGNVREVGKYLGVSYPTARARVSGLLARLGLAGTEASGGALTREQVLAEVASGALTPEEAAGLLAGTTSQ
ncbi:MAG: DUF2089 domain-containing protein [Actinomycetia bacterium]|nr:DUF2089 domain-containing protein [Actinomycetes bacterium]